MEKYRVKKEHPGLQEGEMRMNNHNTYDYVSASGFYLTLEYHKSVIIEWLKEEWVEHVQEPEFTRDDMIRFGKWCDTDNQENKEVYEKALNKWIGK